MNGKVKWALLTVRMLLVIPLVAVSLTLVVLAPGFLPSNPSYAQGARTSEPGGTLLQQVIGTRDGPDLVTLRSRRPLSPFGTGAFYEYIPSANFVPRSSTTTWAYFGVGYIYKTAGSDLFWAPVNMPAGALILGIRLFYCDTGAGNITMWLTYYEAEVSPTFVDVASFTSSGTPGCTSTFLDLSPDHTIRHLNPSTFENRHYVINVSLGSNDSTNRFKSARVFWERPVSPAPASATFTDVPTSHPFFQYIEALADSGITAGCVVSPPQYCPDGSLLRGQMAVFLSRAMGLFWPY